MVISQVANGRSLYGVFKSPEEVAGSPYETHTLWSYDYGTKKAHQYEVTSTGGGMDLAGELTTAGDLILRAPGFDGTSVERRLTWVSPTEVQVRFVVKSGAHSEETQALVWRRTK